MGPVSPGQDIIAAADVELSLGNEGSLNIPLIGVEDNGDVEQFKFSYVLLAEKEEVKPTKKSSLISGQSAKAVDGGGSSKGKKK